ncbi:MAG TPA: hypothetical protein VEQ62_06055 [Stellaceae bacterium]|jgi:hypothetical protein|nr:hypothetical protein [Stellaceae bacterium]
MNDILDDILTSTRKLHRLLSYADALTHGIRRMGHIDPSPFTRAIAMNDILDDILTSTRKLHRLLSYADALTHGIRRMGHIEVDGLRFERQGHELNADGRHTLTYELAGTGKLYHVTIEPVAETHR